MDLYSTHSTINNMLCLSLLCIGDLDVTTDKNTQVQDQIQEIHRHVNNHHSIMEVHNYYLYIHRMRSA